MDDETHTKDFPGRRLWRVHARSFAEAAAIDYIKRQAEHHRRRSFEEEFLAFLKKHAIDYDPKYVWG